MEADVSFMCHLCKCVTTNVDEIRPMRDWTGLSVMSEPNFADRPYTYTYKYTVKLILKDYPRKG